MAIIERPAHHECMLDLETLGKSPRACMLSIGAVIFDADDVVDQFHVYIDPEDHTRYGGVIDASTVLWWMDPQRAEAREVMMNVLPDQRLPLAAGLMQFSNWLGGDRLVHGCGPTFDNAILRAAYEMVGIAPPWNYWNDRCYRTLRGEHREVPAVRHGTFHNALDDAITQAKHLIAIRKSLK